MKSIKTLIAIIFSLNIAVSAAADQGEVPEKIEFKGRSDVSEPLVDYPTQFDGPVVFSHKRHVNTYGSKCGDCHHDSDLDPIEAYDPAETYTCEECHYDTGLVRGPVLENQNPGDERLMHRSNAIHALCLGCHKKTNNEKHLVVAPEACISCHARQ